MFDFDKFPIKLSGKTVDYICPKCKYKFEAPIEAVLEFEQEDEWNGLPISTPPYIICGKCKYNKCVPLDYHSKRGLLMKVGRRKKLLDYLKKNDVVSYRELIKKLNLRK